MLVTLYRLQNSKAFLFIVEGAPKAQEAKRANLSYFNLECTMVPELMKISHFFSYLSDSKNQTIIDKVLLENDRGNLIKRISIQIFRISDLD